MLATWALIINTTKTPVSILGLANISTLCLEHTSIVLRAHMSPRAQLENPWFTPRIPNGRAFYHPRIPCRWNETRLWINTVVRSHFRMKQRYPKLEFHNGAFEMFHLSSPFIIKCSLWNVEGKGVAGDGSWLSFF